MHPEVSLCSVLRYAVELVRGGLKNPPCHGIAQGGPVCCDDIRSRPSALSGSIRILMMRKHVDGDDGGGAEAALRGEQSLARP